MSDRLLRRVEKARRETPVSDEQLVAALKRLLFSQEAPATLPWRNHGGAPVGVMSLPHVGADAVRPGLPQSNEQLAPLGPSRQVNPAGIRSGGERDSRGGPMAKSRAKIEAGEPQGLVFGYERTAAEIQKRANEQRAKREKEGK
jgi:hypothetical protein